MESPYLQEEHTLLRDQLRRFMREEVEPHGEAWESTGHVPRDVLRKMGELGFFGLRYGAEFGGSEMDYLGTVVLSEELGRSTFGGFAITVLVHTDMASPHLANAGTDDQLARYMPGIVSGELITAVGITEPGAGSDVAGIRSRAEKVGSDWVLNGSKIYITNGVMADVYFIAAKTDGSAKGSRGISMFIVEKGTPGFSVARELDKMGWRSSDTAELVLEDCRVPEGNMLGEMNRGFYAVMKNFQNERLTLAAQSLGEAQKAIEITVQYALDREAFGKSLWQQPVIRNRLSMLAAKVASARAFTYETAWRASRGEDVVREVSMLKSLCGELVNDVMYDCQQFHGGFGYMRGTAIERMVRDARVQTIGGGATEVMLEEVAKRMDGLFG
jgi:acyl-CoA dehydrogenase